MCHTYARSVHAENIRMQSTKCTSYAKHARAHAFYPFYSCADTIAACRKSTKECQNITIINFWPPHDKSDHNFLYSIAAAAFCTAVKRPTVTCEMRDAMYIFFFVSNRFFFSIFLRLRLRFSRDFG